MPVIEVKFEVEPNYDGWRLDRYLQQKIPRLSRERIQRLIRERLRQAPGRVLKPASPVRAGQRVVLLKDVDDEPEPGHEDTVRILHDDGALLVLSKPAGMAVHPSARYHKHTVTEWLAEHAPNADGTRPDLAHRIDRETSGLLACGRTKEATRALLKSFVQRDVEKAYLALAFGRIANDLFTIDAPLRLTEEVKVIMEVAEGGMHSVTTCRVLRRGRLTDGTPVTLVACHPLTGRQHQIRVHLAHVGHPLLGDKIYGGPKERFLRFANGLATDEDRAAVRIDRHALHAFRLALPHPVTGERFALEAPLAADLQAFVDTQVDWDDDDAPKLVERRPGDGPEVIEEALEAARGKGLRVSMELEGGLALVDRPLQFLNQHDVRHVIFEGAGPVRLDRVVVVGNT